MPKIETLNQSNRMNVGSPTSIRSSEGARMTGENIAQFGQDIGRAAMTMGQVFKQAQADEEKLTIETAQEIAEAKAKQANFLATQNYDPSTDKDGLGLFNSYRETYQKEMAPLLDGITDEGTRRRVSAVIMNAENSQANDIYATTAKFKAESLELKSLEAYNMMGANVYQSPEVVLSKIIKSDEEIDSKGFTHSPLIKEQLKAERRKGLAATAVAGYIAKGQFSAAEAAVAGELAPFLGGDAEKLGRGIAEARNRERDNRQRATHEYEQSYSKAENERQDEEAGKFYAMLASTTDFDQRQELLADIDVKVARGELKSTQADRLKKVQVTGMGDKSLSDKVAATYVKQLTSAKLSPKFTDNVMRDVAARILDPNEGNKLIQSATAMRNWEKTVKDPSAQAELRQAAMMIEKANQTNGAVQPEFAGRQLAQQVEVNQMVAQGVRPAVAAEKVIKKYKAQDVATVYIPNLPQAQQTDLKSLKAAEPVIQKKVFDLKKQGRAAEATEMVRAYKRRLAALQATEGYNERIR